MRTEPEYVTVDELLTRLSAEERFFADEDRTWWAQHRVTPYAAACDGRAHFVVAVDGSEAIVFFDDEDEFGVAEIVRDGGMTNGGVVGNLVDVIRRARFRERRA